jgi:phosphoribosylformylglycinamidine synthase
MKNVHALVLTGYGLNCDNETAYAFGQVGAKAQKVHINALIDGTVSLDTFQIMSFIGGFSWADDHGAGVIQAVRMKTNIGDKILSFIDRGNLVLGICNGFQTLVNLGLLPGFDRNYQDRRVALTWNESGKFRDDWVNLTINPDSPCIFTKGIKTIELPIRHGEGKFYTDESTLERLSSQKQVVMQYANAKGYPAEGAFPFNPNGSLNDIAGICDPTGRVFGLMPHPEAFFHPTNHPDWTRKKEIQKRKNKFDFYKDLPPLGLKIFKNAVDFFTLT